MLLDLYSLLSLYLLLLLLYSRVNLYSRADLYSRVDLHPRVDLYSLVDKQLITIYENLNRLVSMQQIYLLFKTLVEDEVFAPAKHD